VAGARERDAAETRVYLRHKQVRKNGQTHTYWSLVQSVRHGRRVRQVVVATLGKLDASGRRQARANADKLMEPRLATQR